MINVKTSNCESMLKSDAQRAIRMNQSSTFSRTRSAWAAPLFALCFTANCSAADLDRDPAWTHAQERPPMTAGETRAFIRRLATYVFEHHMKRDDSPQRGMVYEYFWVKKAGTPVSDRKRILAPEEYTFEAEKGYMGGPYDHFVNFFKNSFQHGGVSLEEMLVPLIKMESK